MLECGFKSQLGLEFLGFSNVAFSEARRQGFSLDTPIFSLPSSVNGFSH